VLISYGESGYLGLRETTLEFVPEPDFLIPEVFRAIATWADEEDWICRLIAEFAVI